MSAQQVHLMQEDWFNQGKEDAWSGKPKQVPADPEDASWYDLGYSEGNTQRPPTQTMI